MKCTFKDGMQNHEIWLMALRSYRESIATGWEGVLLICVEYLNLGQLKTMRL